MLEDAAGLAEMQALGISSLPLTLLDGSFVHGWNPGALAELVGVNFDATPRLSPAELAASLDAILAHAEELLGTATPEQLRRSHPERKRTLRFLAFHIFRIGGAFVDGMEQGRYPREWLVEEPPPGMDSGVELANYGANTRERIGAWFAAHREARFGEAVSTSYFSTHLVPTYYGDQSAHLLLERTTWHAGQHLRQAHDLLSGPEDTVSDLPRGLFDGLPMPESLW